METKKVYLGNEEYLEFNKYDYINLKRLYNSIPEKDKIEKANENIIVFKDREFLVQYVKYVLEYLNTQFK
jgi:hypothetical protein